MVTYLILGGVFALCTVLGVYLLARRERHVPGGVITLALAATAAGGALWWGLSRDVPCGPRHFATVCSAPESKMTHLLPQGLKVDDAAAPLTPTQRTALGAQLEALLGCLDALPPGLLPEETARYQCVNVGALKVRDKLGCFTLQLLPGERSTCSAELFLPASRCPQAPVELCRAKGVEPDAKCPCRWRTALSGDFTVLVPSVPGSTRWHLWDLVRGATGCNLIWLWPGVAKCLSTHAVGVETF